MPKSFDAIAVRVALVAATIALFYVVYQKYHKGPHPGEEPVSYIYDTDPKNDQFIKGALTPEQLKKLDRILEEEKKQKGLRLSALELTKLVENDNSIVDAYVRWRKCYDMMRSFHHVIYPSEREPSKN
jgi:hypothetical protein